MEKEKKYSFLKAKQKIEAWCVYRDRCHSEVQKRLHDYGLDTEDTNSLLSHLIEYDFVDEQRYANSFVSGKFNLKKWGIIKIRIHLQKKNVPSKCIEEALKEIDVTRYVKTLKELAIRKWEEKKGDNFEKKVKVQRYLANKGYENELIYEVLKEIT